MEQLFLLSLTSMLSYSELCHLEMENYLFYQQCDVWLRAPALEHFP